MFTRNHDVLPHRSDTIIACYRKCRRFLLPYCYRRPRRPRHFTWFFFFAFGKFQNFPTLNRDFCIFSDRNFRFPVYATRMRLRRLAFQKPFHTHENRMRRTYDTVHTSRGTLGGIPFQARRSAAIIILRSRIVHYDRPFPVLVAESRRRVTIGRDSKTRTVSECPSSSSYIYILRTNTTLTDCARVHIYIYMCMFRRDI